MWGRQTTSKTLICNLSQNSLHYVEIEIQKKKKNQKTKNLVYQLVLALLKIYKYEKLDLPWAGL